MSSFRFPIHRADARLDLPSAVITPNFTKQASYTTMWNLDIGYRAVTVTVTETRVTDPM